MDSVHADSPGKNTGVGCPALLQGSSQPRNRTQVSCIAGGFFYCVNHQRSPLNSSVQSLSCVQLFAAPWTTARQASLSITNSQTLLKLMSVGSVMPSNHLILSYPLLLPPSIFPSIRVFSNESVLCIRWPFNSYILLKENGTQERAGLEEEGRVRERRDRHL